ncbi:hypothetical protein BKA69DRAFT_1126243 [Paraphysoderma sedebokerense]|nr:hypothetical protein BKA69DRAFT_1126243 [Paraphysoderma sedebokerense]
MSFTTRPHFPAPPSNLLPLSLQSFLPTIVRNHLTTSFAIFSFLLSIIYASLGRGRRPPIQISTMRVYLKLILRKLAGFLFFSSSKPSKLSNSQTIPNQITLLIKLRNYLFTFIRPLYLFFLSSLTTFGHIGTKPKKSIKNEVQPRDQSSQTPRIIQTEGVGYPKLPKLTISLKNSVLWSPSSTHPNYAFLESTLPLIRSLSSHFDVYFLVPPPPHANAIIELLEAVGIFEEGVHKDKVFVCRYNDSVQSKEEEGKLMDDVHINDGISSAGSTSSMTSQPSTSSSTSSPDKLKPISPSSLLSISSHEFMPSNRESQYSTVLEVLRDISPDIHVESSKHVVKEIIQYWSQQNRVIKAQSPNQPVNPYETSQTPNHRIMKVVWINKLYDRPDYPTSPISSQFESVLSINSPSLIATPPSTPSRSSTPPPALSPADSSSSLSSASHPPPQRNTTTDHTHLTLPHPVPVPPQTTVELEVVKSIADASIFAFPTLKIPL